MSEKSKAIAARSAALGLRIISNDMSATEAAPIKDSAAAPSSTTGNYRPRSASEPLISSGFLRNRNGNSRPAEPAILDTSLAGNFHNHGGIYSAKASESNKGGPRIGFVTAHAGVPAARDYPRTNLSLVTISAGDTLESSASVFATWLEGQYHANVAPFDFLGVVPLHIEDMPEAEVVDLAIKMLKGRGWQVGDVIDPRNSGRSAGSIVLMHPDSTGF